MFGKKRKLAKQQAELAKKEAELKAQQTPEQDVAPQEQASAPLDQEENKVFVESEILTEDEAVAETDNASKDAQKDDVYVESELLDEELGKELEAIAYLLKEDAGADLKAQEPEEVPVATLIREADAPQQEEQTEQVEQAETVVDESVDDVAEESADEEPVSEPAPAPQQEEEEVVYVVEGEDDDEVVKPAKLAKLPNLVDYMLSQNMSRRMKLNVATLLTAALNKYKDIPAEKKIIVECMAKVIASLQN